MPLSVCSLSLTLVPVTSGVPQGSVIGPLLFLLYINDVCDSIPSSVTLKLFADDVKIYARVSNVVALQSALTYVSLWSDD